MQNPATGGLRPSTFMASALKRDVWAGALMVAFGAVAVAEGRRLSLGTLTNMGPGYLPFVLGVLLLLVGVAIMAGSVLPQAPDAIKHRAVASPDWRGCAAIIAGVIAFIVLGEFAGLAPATFGLVFISAMGDRAVTVRGALILAAVITAVAVGVFVYLLQVQFPIVRW